MSSIPQWERSNSNTQIAATALERVRKALDDGGSPRNQTAGAWESSLQTSKVSTGSIGTPPFA